MPELHYYTVIEEREVKVSATNPIDAANLAERVFNGEKKPEDQINVQSSVRKIGLLIREDN